MKKLLYGALLVALAGLVVAPALAEDDTKLDVHAEVWSRTEYMENFTDFEDTNGAPPSDRDNVDFTTYRARINFGLAVTDEVSAGVEVQNVGVWGNGFPYYSNSQDPNIGTGQLNDLGGTNDTTLYQGWVMLKNVGGSPLSLKVGRQEHVLGNELHMGDADFYGGQYFDGIRGTLDFEAWDMDFFWYKIQERSIAPGSIINLPPSTLNGGSDDADLYGVTAAFNIGEGHELEPYLLVKRDGAEGTPFWEQYYAATLGALYEHPRAEDGMFDWRFEAAYQTGEVKNFLGGSCPAGGADCDLASMIAEGEFGATFAEKHRVAIGGLFIGDGDDAQDREDFFSIAPDTHRRAGAMDLFSEISSAFGSAGSDTFHNLTNLYLAYGWTGETQSFEVAFHNFACTEDGFGPDGLPFTGDDLCVDPDTGLAEDDIGQEVDLIYNLNSNEYVNLQIGVGQFMPGDLAPSTSEDDAMRAWAMLRFRN